MEKCFEPHAAHCNGWIRQHTQSPPLPTMAGVSEGPKWWERTEEPDTVWRACVTDDGLDYYVNTETNETSHVQHAAYQHGTRLAVDGPRAMDIRYYYYCHTSFVC